MSDELIIRPIEAADFDQVWPIIRDVVQAQETYAFDPNMDRETAWKTWVELPRATFVAEQDGQILGTYYIKANAAELKADYALVCDTGMWDRETPLITSTLRGMVYQEVTLTAADRP